MRDLLENILNEANIFKAVPQEELMKRPGWAAEQERLRLEREKEKMELEQARADAKRMQELAKAVGFTPGRIPDDSSLRWNVEIKAKRKDGATLRLTMDSNIIRMGSKDRLTVTLDYEGTTRGLHWEHPVRASYFHFRRPDEHLIAAIQRRVKDLDAAIANSKAAFKRESDELAAQKLFLKTGREILGGRHDKIVADSSGHLEDGSPGGQITIGPLPLDMFTDVLKKVRDIVK